MTESRGQRRVASRDTMILVTCITRSRKTCRILSASTPSNSTTCMQAQLLATMEQQDVVRHFTDVASSYDALYGFAYDYIPEFAIKHLQLKPDDVLADIGAGTGAISSLILKKAGEEITAQLYLNK